MTLDADRRRLERAALNDPGEATRAHGRERLRALGAVPVAQQTAALDALVVGRGTIREVGTWTYTRSVRLEVKALLQDALRARPRGAVTWLGAAGPRTLDRVAIVIAARVAGAIALGIGRGPDSGSATFVAIGARRAWPHTWPWSDELGLCEPKRYVRAAEAHARIAAWALRPAEDRVLLSLEAARHWARPEPLGPGDPVFTTAPGGNDRFGVSGGNVFTAPPPLALSVATAIPAGTVVGVDEHGLVAPMRNGLTLLGTVRASHPSCVQVDVAPSPFARGWLELRLGDAVARRTFPPEPPT